VWKLTLYGLLFFILMLLITAHSPGAPQVTTSTPLAQDGQMSGRPRELVIAAASNLTFVVKEVAAKFEEQTGTRVKLALGSSGNFYGQIVNGAPFDLFLSADAEYPQKLVEAGLAQPESLSIYAVGRMVLWVPKSSPIDVGKLGIESLLHPTVRKIAIANPALAPYGKAAVAVMDKSRLYQGVSSKLVLGENVSQTAQFVQSGAADIGIIPLSLIIGSPLETEGSYWEVPADLHPRVEQGVVVLKRTKAPELAQQFLQVLLGAEGSQIMTRYGYQAPATAAP